MAGFSVVLSLLQAFSIAAAASPIHADVNPLALFAFSDSLSDVGNNNVLPKGAFKANYPYYGIDFPGVVSTGRVTNGYNFIDVIAQRLGFQESPPAFHGNGTINNTFTGVNYASGGSRILLECKSGTTKMCFTMREQIDSFITTRLKLWQKLGPEATEELISKSIFTFTCGTNEIIGFIYRHKEELSNMALLANWTKEFNQSVGNMTLTFRDQLKGIQAY